MTYRNSPKKKMKYQSAIKTIRPETLHSLQPGQWIDYAGTKGRWMGERRGVQWIAWSKTATHRFRQFANAFKGGAFA